MVDEDGGSSRVAATGMRSGGLPRCAGRCALSVWEMVALERPDGLLIDRLLDTGVALVATHPNRGCPTLCVWDRGDWFHVQLAIRSPKWILSARSAPVQSWTLRHLRSERCIAT
jgi:hypothetical protein